MRDFNFSRRKFLISSATVSGGLVLGVSFAGRQVEATSPTGHVSFKPEAFLQITSENEVIFQLDKHEMGQGIHTALPTIICEELGIDPRNIQLRLSQISEDYQATMQMTGGSTSVTTKWDLLREAGAKARSMLVSSAAERWQVDPSQCEVINGSVHHQSDSLTFGDLASAASAQPVPENVSLKAPKDFKYVGKSLRRLDGFDKSTGKTIFGIDVSMDGLINAVVLRDPHFYNDDFNFDATQAEKSPGVIKIFKISSGLAIAADTYWHARKASKLIKIDWPNSVLGDLNSDAILEERQQLAKSEEGEEIHRVGDSKKALGKLDKVIEATYEVPYLAHATMEPQNTTALYANGEVTVWSPTQFTDGTQAYVAEALDIPRAKIKVYGTMMGGGFGRRAVPDFAVEAAEISRVTRKPVKVLWSREDDMRHDYYRPSTYNVLRGGIDERGNISAWEHKLIAPSIFKRLLPAISAIMAPQWIPEWLVNAVVKGAGSLAESRDPTTSEGSVEIPYAIEHIDVRHVFHDPGIPIGFWRSVGHSQNAFITESFIDELAALDNQDPYNFRRKLLKGHDDYLRVLDLVATKSNWGKAQSGSHQGIAIHKSFGTIVAEVVEIEYSDGISKLKNITCAIDCGIPINPDQVKAQVESAVVFGLTAALKGEITIENGAVKQSNFHDYQMIRMNETPPIEVHIVESSAAPTGVGEPGTPPIAPAIANALFAATGKRQRRLPLSMT